jgi:hypothetical protein
MKPKKKTSRTQTRIQKGTEKSRGGGRLDGKDATTNPKKKRKNTSDSNEKKAF